MVELVWDFAVRNGVAMYSCESEDTCNFIDNLPTEPPMKAWYDGSGGMFDGKIPRQHEFNIYKAWFRSKMTGWLQEQWLFDGIDYTWRWIDEQ